MGLIHVYFTDLKAHGYFWLFFLAMTVGNFVFVSPLFALIFLTSLGAILFLQVWSISHGRKWHVYTKIMPIKPKNVVLTWYFCFAITLGIGIALALVAIAISSFFVETRNYMPIVLLVSAMWVTFISFYIPVHLAHKSELSKVRYIFVEILLIPLPLLQLLLILGGVGRVTVLSFAGDDPLYQILSYAATGTAFVMYLVVSAVLFIASIAVSMALYKKIDF